MIIQKEAQVPFTPAQMFELVNQVENYANFLPWCSESLVLERSDIDMIGKLTISGMGMNKSFTTRNTWIPNQEVRMEHLEGPFQSLEGTWTFEPVGSQGCLVKLCVQFELKPGLKSMVLGTLFRQAATKLVEAFCTRAHELYDPR